MMPQSINNWDIRYSQYVNDLIVFDKKISSCKREQLQTDVINSQIYITKNKSNNNILMVKITSAEKIFGDINNYSKEEVINKVKEYIK